MSNVLNNPVLVLNRSWIAVRVQTLKKALSKVTNNRAKFLDPETYTLYDWESWLETFFVENGANVDYPVIKTKYLSFKMPEIIVCTRYNKIPHISLKLSRRNLLIRDLFRCQYTGQKVSYKTATLDHVLPKSKGGKTTWNNLVVCSLEANVKKADRTPEEAGMRLLKSPKKPMWSPIYSISSKKRPASWGKFIKKEHLELIDKQIKEEEVEIND